MEVSCLLGLSGDLLFRRLVWAELGQDRQFGPVSRGIWGEEPKFRHDLKLWEYRQTRGILEAYWGGDYCSGLWRDDFGRWRDVEGGYVSWSHARGRLFWGRGRGAMGLDLEHLDQRLCRLSWRFSHEAQVARAATCPRFAALQWTLREAIYKAAAVKPKNWREDFLCEDGELNLGEFGSLCVTLAKPQVSVYRVFWQFLDNYCLCLAEKLEP